MRKCNYITLALPLTVGVLGNGVSGKAKLPLAVLGNRYGELVVLDWCKSNKFRDGLFVRLQLRAVLGRELVDVHDEHSAR